MSKGFLLHLVYLFLALTISFFWTHHPVLSFYTLQLIALFVVIFFGKNFLWQKKTSPTVDALILSLVVLFLVFSTGGADSPLFFLIYFLLFGLSFLFEPQVPLIFSLGLIVFLAPSVKTINEVGAIFSLVLITPLSLFFGQLYLENLKNKKRIKFYRRRWLTDEESLIREEGNVLFWLTTEFKPTVIEVWDKVCYLLADISRLTPTQKATLKRIRRLVKRLMKRGERLQQLIDRETDED